MRASQQRKLIVLAALLPVLQSCIAIPVAVPEKKPFSEDFSEVLVPGVTTPEEIEARFSSPVLRGNNWWIYRDVRETWGWLICAGGAYSAACGTTDRGHSNYFLIVDFDADGAFQRHEVVRQSELCERRRICYNDELVTVAATDEADRAAKEFARPPTGCNVYLYAHSRSGITPSRVTFDFGTIGELTTRDGFYHLNFTAGSHHLAVKPTGAMWSGAAANMGLDCVEGELLFLIYRKGGFWRFPRVEVVDEAEGRVAIGMRWLAWVKDRDVVGHGAH